MFSYPVASCNAINSHRFASCDKTSPMKWNGILDYLFHRQSFNCSLIFCTPCSQSPIGFVISLQWAEKSGIGHIAVSCHIYIWLITRYSTSSFSTFPHLLLWFLHELRSNSNAPSASFSTASYNISRPRTRIGDVYLPFQEYLQFQITYKRLSVRPILEEIMNHFKLRQNKNHSLIQAILTPAILYASRMIETKAKKINLQQEKQINYQIHLQ